MELLKLLLSINLTVIIIQIVTGNNLQSVEFFNHNFKSIKLKRYNVDLILYMDENDCQNTDFYNIPNIKSYINKQREKGNFIFYGESTIFFEDIHRKHIIRLNVLNLEIYEAETQIIYTIDGIDNIIIPKNHIYHNDAQTIDIYFNHPFLPDFDTFRLNIKFVGSVSDITGGFFKTTYINDDENKTWFITAADFQGTGARRIFPCWDQPYIRANFTISIKNNKNYMALSNMPIDTKSASNDMTWTRFKTTNKISPYHVAIVLFTHDYYYNRNMWCRYRVKQEIKFAHAVARKVTLNLKQIFNNITFLLTVDHVVIPNFRDEGVESWGLVLYRESDILYDKRLDFVARKIQVARVVSRKVVHQFLGNLVSQSSWSHLWLNEAIATFWAMHIVNKFVHSHLMNLFTVQLQQESLRLNNYYDMPLVSNVNVSSDNSPFTFTYYIKAPAFVRSLLQEISIDELRIGLNKYLTMYQFESIDPSISTIDNFFNVLQEIRNNSNKSQINLAKRFVLWRRERYPVLQVTRKPGNKVVIYALSQKNPNETFAKKTWICVTYTTQSAFNSTKKGWLNPHKPSLHLDQINKTDWIIVNVQQAGYYRVNYDNNNWQKLVKYLNSTEYSNIHVLNRAQIIDDAYYFLSTNQLNFNLFKKLTYYLSNETDYVAWYPMFKIFEQISGYFPFPQSTEVKEYFRNILDNILGQKIHFVLVKENFKEDIFRKCLRQEAVKWACILNSWGCINSAYYKLKQINEQPYSRLAPGWRAWTICNGLKIANNITWNRVSEIQDNDILEYLTCAKNHIINYINRLKSGYFKEEKHILIFHSIIARYAKTNVVLDYILSNFVAIVPRKMRKIIAFADIINHLYYEEQLDKMSDYAQDYFTPDERLYIDKKIATRTLEIKKHLDYFEGFLKSKH